MDCYAALLWLVGAAGELGVDRDRLAVLGQSAGGGLAAAVALFSRDHQGPSLRLQFLNQPMLDDRASTHSMKTFHDTPVWDATNAQLCWHHYLGDDGGEISPYAAPARATDLHDLAPAYIAAMEYDPLRDEAIRYAQALLESGVNVELHCYAGTFHVAEDVAPSAFSRRFRAEQLFVLRRALGLPT